MRHCLLLYIYVYFYLVYKSEGDTTLICENSTLQVFIVFLLVSFLLFKTQPCSSPSNLNFCSYQPVNLYPICHLCLPFYCWFLGFCNFLGDYYSKILFGDLYSGIPLLYLYHTFITEEVTFLYFFTLESIFAYWTRLFIWPIIMVLIPNSWIFFRRSILCSTIEYYFVYVLRKHIFPLLLFRYRCYMYHYHLRLSEVFKLGTIVNI